MTLPVVDLAFRPDALEFIAGWPVELSAGVGVPLPVADGNAGRTLYVAHRILSNPSSQSAAYGRFGADFAGSARSRLLHVAGSAQLRIEHTTAGDVAAGSATTTGPYTVGPHVSAMRMGGGLLGGFVDGVRVTQQGVAAPNYTDQRAWAYDVPNSTPLRGVAYPAAHDDATLARVTAWLARRYGTPVPAGY